MYFGEKPRKGLSKFVAVLTALAIASASLLAVPAYAAESGAENQNPVMEFFGNIADGAAQLFGLGDDGVETYAVTDTRATTADPDTTNVWSDIAASSTSTQNIGRIWTDKSVFDHDYNFSGSIGDQIVSKGDSDFLVSLSALSSTSNLKTVTTSTKPLDIVLVVDTSGSMDNSAGHDMGYSYSPTYNVNGRGTYYIQVGGRWTELEHSNRDGWYYGPRYNPTYVTPARWEGDTEGGRVQFYTRSNQQMSRMEALQNAANAFVDSVAAMNDNISDTAQRHRISLVKFASDENNSIGNGTDRDGYNYSQVVSDLTAYTTQTASTLKNTINSLEGEGATRADYGMHQAQRVLDGDGNLTGARSDAQKVVIFFTDGNPTTSSAWSNSVAGTAINYAYDMKQDGALVYSIGVFQGANPSDTSNNFNRYMNAVSSNYPDAQCGDEVYVGGGFWDPQYEWRQTDDYSDLVLGNRAEGAEGEEDPQYYFAASNADELSQVFDDITTSITSNAGSGSPIEEVTHEGAVNPGTLTFTDELGSYMEVSGDTMTVVYGDLKSTSTGKTTEGNVDTYHFEGTVEGNAVYKEADLADLTVTVTHGETLAAGDKVTVQIPASLIPMRHYDVDSDAKTMSVTSAYPIRLFYGVSVKADAKTAINTGFGDVYDAIVSTNKTDDGKVAFYSNLYNSGNGDTTATFVPSDGNKFYYYTQNTNLYIDEDCTQRATTQNVNQCNTLYYSEPYWEITSGNSAQEVTRGIAIYRDGQDWSKMTTDRQGNYYIPGGTQRLDRPASLNANKTNNETGTAPTVLTPSWEGTGVTQRLGNNGKITYDLPGALEIKKSVDWGNASDDTKQNQNSFKFTVNFNGDATLAGNFTYDVYESGEEPVDNGTVADGGTITLKDGQRAVIKGLPADTTFAVTETEANKNGFTTTDTVTSDPSNGTTDGIANGTIAGGSQQSVSFQNNYKAAGPLEYDTSTGLNVEKVLNGRDWRDGDEFTFNVQALDGYEPKQSEVIINKNTTDHKASFGTITFDKDGEFRYVVREDNDTESPIVGIDYSNATYRLTVKVVDAGNGKLKIESTKLEMFQDDTGAEKNPAVAVEGATATFTNDYLSDRGTINIDGKKAYEDITGGNQIGPNKFQFQMEALGGYVTDGGSRDDLTVSADNTPKPTENTQGNVTTIGNVGNEFHMPTIYFDGNDVGNTYVYKITEVQGNEDGMTYDQNSYEVEVTVTEVPDPEAGEGHVHIQATANKTPEQLTFTNTYEPTAAELKGDDAIHGTKTLEGRQMKEGETFYFQLSALNDNAKTVLTAPETVTVTDQNSMDFTFAGMTFTKVGTYTFQVNEVADENGTETTNANGMTFDTNIATVTVTVTDGNDSDDPADHGKLLASVSYSNDKHSNVTDHAQFTNVYKANMNYGAGGAGGIAVTKTIVDRTMDAGDYNFTLTGTGPDGEITETFENTAAAANGTVTMKQLQNLTFDEQDAEKTFTFTVDEADPTDENRLPGVEYDQSQYRVDITVHDNHDGNMYTETTVTKIKNADGTEANEIVVDKLNSSTAQGQVPTFGFTNTYKPTEASLDGDTALKVTKKVTGAPSAADYTFTLTAQETPDGSVANIGGLTDGKLTVSTNGVINQDATDNTDDDTQTVSFDKLTFSKPGTYTFTVQENQPDADDGWTFDTDEHKVTVVVSDLNEDNEYDGALHIKSVTPQGPTVITNSYKADPVIVGGDGAQQKITVQKSVTGADSTADFTFKIEPVIDDDHSEQWWRDRVKATEGFSPELTISGVTQKQDVTKAFAGIQFNAVGEYKFNVTEVGAAEFNAGADRKGWTYDEHTAVVTVKVTDEGNDGQLDAEVVYDNTSATTTADQGVNNAASFTNKYEAGSTTLTGSSTTFNGSKTVTGRDWLDGESFGFTMKPVEQEGVDWSSVTYKADDSSEPVAVGENTATATENGDETVPFWFPGSYTFTKVGTYTLNVSETQHNGKALPQDDTNGMTYDRHTGVITVTVEDNGEGQLVATPKYEEMTFENKYEAEPVTWGLAADELLGGHKYINDTTGNTYTLGEGQFSFTMRAQAANNPMPDGWVGTKDSQGRGMMTVTNGTGNATEVNVYDFGWIEFTHADMTGATAVDGQPGVYTKDFQYNIFETGNMPAGISKDNTAYTVTFKVTEDYNTGRMTVTPSAVKIVNGGDGEGTTGDAVDVAKLDFTNTYNPTSISSYMNIFKTLKGRNWQQGDTFTFNVSMSATETDGSEWPQGAPLPGVDTQGSNYQISEVKTNDAGNGFDYTVTINPTSATGNTYRFDTGKITYEREGIYTYKVSEAQSTVANVTADDTEYTVVVKVTDENGALKREVTSVTPVLTDHGTGDQVFAALDFTNTYTPTASEGVPTNFALQKTFTGHEWTNDYAFEFVLSPVDGAPMPKANQDAGVTIDNEGNAHKTISAPTGDSKDTATFDFGAISYDKAGTYTYAVTEVKGNHGGVTYDSNTVNIAVEVKDVAGQLVATATVTGSFTNTYKTSAEYNANGAGGLDITKQVTNHAMADGQFSFTITATGDNAEAAAKKLGIQNGVSTEVKSAAAAAGVATSVKSNPFETVSFDKSDDGVTYTYTIKENGKTGEGDYKNYVLDTNTYTVEITPTDNGDGTMTVKTVVNGTEYSNQRATVAFVNSYQADPTTVGAQGAAKIEGTKTLKNDVLTDGQFTFQVKSGDVVVATGTNDANGNITFSNITYTTENLAAAVTPEGSDNVGTATAQTTDAGTVYTFNYTVSEVDPDPDQSTGVTANTGAQYITVTVTDDGNGTLTPQVTYGTGNPLAFENTYGGNADFALDITGAKEIVGGQTNPTNIPTLKGGEYEFTITGTPAKDGTPAPMPATTTVKNDAAGGVTFEDIHYTMENTFGNKPATTDADAEAMADEATIDEATADEGIETYKAGRTQVFTYTISESGSVSGVTNEQGTKTVQVTVTDLGGGKLEAKVTSEKVDGADFKFTNVYDVTETTSSLTGVGGFTITKDFSSTNTDRALAEGDFEFQLKGGDTVITATNAADGTVSFGGITFTKPGTYNYVLSEVDGGKPGVDYDTTGYNVTAKAEDMGDGTLKVTWEMPQAVDGGVTFANTYTAANTGITFEAAKVLDGRELTDGEFTFELRENGKVIDTATNDADGTVAFEKVEYTEPGAHDYEIAEVEGDDSTITYDDTVFTVHVNVIDNTQTGSLDASDWSYGENGAPVFHNTYTKPAEPPAPKPEEPKPEVIPATGDAAAAAVMATAGIGAALAAAGYVTSKKRGE